MKWYFVMLVFAITSCQEPKRQLGSPGNNQPLNSELKSILIDYQQRFPIPLSDKRGGLYIYLVSFYIKGNDTILTIKRPADGLSLEGWDLVLGVYKDSFLLPTFIRDDSALYSKGLINKQIRDSASIQFFKPAKGSDYSESFPPVYQYRKTKGKLILDRIDTVWTNW